MLVVVRFGGNWVGVWVVFWHYYYTTFIFHTRVMYITCLFNIAAQGMVTIINRLVLSMALTATAFFNLYIVSKIYWNMEGNKLFTARITQSTSLAYESLGSSCSEEDNQSPSPSQLLPQEFISDAYTWPILKDKFQAGDVDKPILNH